MECQVFVGFQMESLEGEARCVFHSAPPAKHSTHLRTPHAGTAYEKRMRAAKVRQSIATVRAGTEDYAQRADIASRLRRQGGGGQNASEGGGDSGDALGGVKRTFNQLTPLDAEGRAVAGYGGAEADGFQRGAAGREGGGLHPQLLQKVFGGSEGSQHIPKPRRQ